MGDPRMQGLPMELQARLQVALTLGAHLAAIRELTNAVGEVLRHEAPRFTAYGEALDNHVRFMEQYFRAAELDAYGRRILGVRVDG